MTRIISAIVRMIYIRNPKKCWNTSVWAEDRDLFEILLLQGSGVEVGLFVLFAQALSDVSTHAHTHPHWFRGHMLPPQLSPRFMQLWNKVLVIQRRATLPPHKKMACSFISQVLILSYNFYQKFWNVLRCVWLHHGKNEPFPRSQETWRTFSLGLSRRWNKRLK